jgi:hypothetical protein
MTTPNQGRGKAKAKGIADMEKTEEYLAIPNETKRKLYDKYIPTAPYRKKQKIVFTTVQQTEIFLKYLNHHVGQIYLDVSQFLETVDGWELHEMNDLLPKHQRTTPPKTPPGHAPDANDESRKALEGGGT